MINVGVQGDKGSFSEQAALSFINQQKITQYEIHYLISSEKVLHFVEQGKINFGIFAIENSQGGIVIESIHALANHLCEVIDMFPIQINQNLFVKPGTKPSDIKTIHSHRQAIRQCHNFITKHYPDCKLIEEKDTAESARLLANDELPHTSAVIGNKACENIYGLEILHENIQDLEKNLTLFLAVTQKS